MTLTVSPIISESKVVEVSLRFDDAISISGFRKLLDAIDTILNDTHIQDEHQHNFINYPVYNHGEMIAVIQKCSCGKTKRLPV